MGTRYLGHLLCYLVESSIPRECNLRHSLPASPSSLGDGHIGGDMELLPSCPPLGQSPWLRVNTSFPEEPRRQPSPRDGKSLPAQSLWFLLAYSSPLLSEEELWHQSQRKGIKKGTINGALREGQVKLELLLASNLIVPVSPEVFVVWAVSSYFLLLHLMIFPDPLAERSSGRESFLH